MHILICGGCKSGKSSLAQELALRLSGGAEHFYVATMLACDDEDRLRIARHVENRAGMGFQTLEISRDIAQCLKDGRAGGTFLIDSVTALLANEMFHDGGVDSAAEARTQAGLMQVIKQAKNAVFVSDFIFSEATHFDALTEEYRRALGALHCALANACDSVIEMCAGTTLVHKGVLPE